MKNRKKGISLIVLIITIIVIIILAAAIILSMVKNNTIKNAKKAVSENDVKVAQEALTAWIGERWVNENNGSIGEEVGALYTGKVTKEPSEVEVNLDGKISTIQVTLEELGLEMLEEIVIEKNVVKSILKNGHSYNQGTDENDSNTNQGGGSVVDSTQYHALVLELNNVKDKVNQLETSLSETKEEMVAIQASAITRDILFDGSANATNKNYDLVQNADLSKYKYLIVYTDAIEPNTSNRGLIQSTMIHVEDITINHMHQFAIGCVNR